MTTVIAPDPTTAPPPPGPSAGRLPALLRRTRTDVLGMMDAVAAEYGDVVQLRVLGQRIVVARGAEVARHMLVTAQDRYPKSHQFDLFVPALGNGLVTSAGEDWRRSRRIAQPVFAKRHLGVYAGHMSSAATRALDAWEREWRDGDVIALDRAILTVGLDTVGRALATHDFGHDGHAFEEAMAGALHEIGTMSRAPLAFLGQDVRRLGIVRAARLGTPRRWRRYLAHSDTSRAIIEALVDDRIANGHGDRDDLLRLLMETEDADGGGRLGRDQVVDEVGTFIAAGHETTAHGLTWMFYLLAAHPEAAARLRDELGEQLGGRVPGVEDAERLPWLDACFKEAMRVYPPVWHIPRLAAEDDVLGGYRIEAGTRVLLSVWSTHRDPSAFEHPTEFRPQRWLDEPTWPRHAYLPFGGGRRACIGQGFAQLNAMILGAAIAQRYTFERAPGRTVRFEPSITLRPADGVAMVARRA